MKHRITDPATDRRNNRNIIGLDPILTRNLVTRMHHARQQKQASTRRRAAFARVTGLSAILQKCKNVLAFTRSTR
jgi:GTP1/Obg family GTP-binding protein